METRAAGKVRRGRERGDNGGVGRAVEHAGMAHGLSAFEGGEGPYDRLEAADSGGWSSAITPLCPFSRAQKSGVWPC